MKLTVMLLLVHHILANPGTRLTCSCSLQTLGTGCVVTAANHRVVLEVCLTSDTNLMCYAMFHCSFRTASLEPEVGTDHQPWCS